MATAITDSAEITLEAPSIIFRDAGGTQRLTLAGANVGFFGAPSVARPGATGDVHTVAAGSVTGVFTNTTFDGTTGATAYTIGDIVKALKAVGLIAA